MPLSSLESILPLYTPLLNVSLQTQCWVGRWGCSPRDLGTDRLLFFSILRVRTLHWPFQASAISFQHRLGWAQSFMWWEGPPATWSHLPRTRISWPLLLWTGVWSRSISSRKQKHLTCYNHQSHHFIHSIQHSFSNYILSAYHVLEETVLDLKWKERIHKKEKLQISQMPSPQFCMDYKREEWCFSKDDALVTNVYL